MPTVLKHGSQDDGVSCGIVTANTITRAVLGDVDVWTDATKLVERATWFVRLGTAHMVSESVSLPT